MKTGNIKQNMVKYLQVIDMEIKRPLAYRARPKKLDEIVGQEHILGKNGVIRRMIDNEKIKTFLLLNCKI